MSSSYDSWATLKYIFSTAFMRNCVVYENISVSSIVDSSCDVENCTFVNNIVLNSRDPIVATDHIENTLFFRNLNIDAPYLNRVLLSEPRYSAIIAPNEIITGFSFAYGSGQSNRYFSEEIKIFTPSHTLSDYFIKTFFKVPHWDGNYTEYIFINELNSHYDNFK